MSRLKKTITITILPGLTEQSRQWTLPRWAFFMVIFLILLTFGGVISLIAFYSYETKKFMALKYIQSETHLQKEHLEHYRKKLESIEAQLSEVNNLDAQIMNMVAKGAPAVRPENSASSGKGPGAGPENAAPPPSPAIPAGFAWSYEGTGRRFSIPVNGWVTSSFGERKGPMGSGEEFHPGLDIAQEEGTTVRSPASGVVLFKDRTPDYGNYVIVYHGLGISSLFAHLDQVEVVEGQSISRNDPIGTIGLTGLTTAPHLHYEAREFGHPVDPKTVFGNQIPDFTGP